MKPDFLILVSFTYDLPVNVCTSGIDEKIDLFNVKINEPYNKCCPIRFKTITNKYIKSPWITPAIKNSIRTK